MKRLAFTRNEPPIGFCAPPDSAAHSAPAWIAVVTFAALATCIVGIASYDALHWIMAPRDQLSDAQLFPKDPARCCDANGNEVRR